MWRQLLLLEGGLSSTLELRKSSPCSKEAHYLNSKRKIPSNLNWLKMSKKRVTSQEMSKKKMKLKINKKKLKAIVIKKHQKKL